MHYTIHVPEEDKKKVDIAEVHVVSADVFGSVTGKYLLDGSFEPVSLDTVPFNNPEAFNERLLGMSLDARTNLVVIGEEGLQLYRVQERKKAGLDYPGIGTGIVLVNKYGKIPLLRRSSMANNRHGEWDLPGGTVELGERIEEAVPREGKEETGLDSKLIGLLRFDQDFVEGQHWISFAYVAKVTGGELKLMEPHKFDAIEWFDPADPPENTSGLTLRVLDTYRTGPIFMPRYQSGDRPLWEELLLE